MTQFEPGDRVTHNPTGAEWMLVAVYGSYVVPAGPTPCKFGLASDCTLICACTTTKEREACTRACDAVVL
jgi:hypothetical protein